MAILKKIIFTIFFIVPAIAFAEQFTVVIDPGHGGKDSGAVGTSAKEKDINLGVALKLGKLIKDNFSDVKVVYTRDNDVFIPLQTRADIANKAAGDLFISIHTNSIDKSSKNYLTVAGASVYTLGFRRSEENLAVALRENSVIKLEADYTTTYEGFDPSSSESYIIFEMSRDKHMEQSIEAASAMQNELVSTAGRLDHGVRQANFWVLFKTSMPAILVELDFICNPQSEKFMSSESGQNKLADALFRGFKAYKKTDDQRRLTIAGKTNGKQNKKTDSRKVQTAGQTSKTSQPAPSTQANDKTKENNKPEQTQQSTPAVASDSPDRIVYKIQFLVSSTKLSSSSPKLKDIPNWEFYEDQGLFKYTTGAYSSPQEAQKELTRIRKLFSDAFVIKTQGGKRIK